MAATKTFAIKDVTLMETDAKENVAEDIPVLEQAVTADDLLSMKLRQEINHLKRWLAAQHKTRPHRTNDLTPTIEALIATRQKLLDNLENQN